MDQLGAEVELGNRFEHGAGEEDEAFAVVAVVGAALGVELGSVVVGVVLHEVDGDADSACAVAGERAPQKGS